MASKETTADDPAQAVDANENKGVRAARRHARVTVFANWCKGCGLCVAFCPRKVFEEDAEGHPVVAFPERCTSCNWCVIHCPDFAIVLRLEEEPEVAAGACHCEEAGE